MFWIRKFKSRNANRCLMLACSRVVFVVSSVLSSCESWVTLCARQNTTVAKLRLHTFETVYSIVPNASVSTSKLNRPSTAMWGLYDSRSTSPPPLLLMLVLVLLWHHSNKRTLFSYHAISSMAHRHTYSRRAAVAVAPSTNAAHTLCKKRLQYLPKSALIFFDDNLEIVNAWRKDFVRFSCTQWPIRSLRGPEHCRTLTTHWLDISDVPVWQGKFRTNSFTTWRKMYGAALLAFQIIYGMNCVSISC